MKKALLIMAVLIMAMVQPRLAAATPADPDQGASLSTMNVAELEARGDSLRAQKDFLEAIRCYKEAVKREPKNAGIYNKMGIAELRQNHYPLAETYFKKAIKYNNQDAHAMNNLGVVYFSRKNYGSAVKYYKKALAIEEGNATYHSNLGTAWFSQKKYDRATAEYSRALEIDPLVFVKQSQAGSIAHVANSEDRANFEFVLAKLFAQRGDWDACFHWLQKAKEDGYNKMKDVYKAPEFAKVLQDPRLAQIVPPPAQAGF